VLKVEYRMYKGFISGVRAFESASDWRRIGLIGRMTSLDTPPATRILSIQAFFRNPDGTNHRRKRVVFWPGI
jgi:hypothetical protein